MRPRWEVVGSYFYQQPVEHILCGFVHERIPYSGAYLWYYAFPLFVPSDFMHLTFGDRLPPPQGFLPRDFARSAAAEAEEFVRRIEPYEAETYSWGSLPGFLTLSESRRSSENPEWDRVHALTLILLGRYEEAARELDELARRTDLGSLSAGSVEEIRAHLARGGEPAVKCLKRWEADSKRRFGIR